MNYKVNYENKFYNLDGGSSFLFDKSLKILDTILSKLGCN